ncbi:acyl carrier protein [Salinibacterium sp. PAMC 21357]|uniref:acyl carrier protein n=1 Tax=Salinibacterium sp. PAMC 21357 TaxID=1112215 RepID=UPI000287E500|nr:acyl carrier protein [Salinibacterium sp. PAMC 21357]
MEQSVFISLIAGILEVEPQTVSMTDVLEDIDWDSLSNISFIADIDSEANVTVNADDLSNATTVADLFALVNGADQAK